MEVQILHYNTKYDSPEEAADATDGFAALSVFYQMDVTISNNLDYLYDILPNVTQPGSSHIIRTPFPLALLLPDVTGEFYRCIKVGRKSKSTRETYLSFRYRGSQTAPPCTENVIWTVFKHVGQITLKQLSAFDKLVGIAVRAGQKAAMLGDNFRGVQARCLFFCSRHFCCLRNCD